MDIKSRYYAWKARRYAQNEERKALAPREWAALEKFLKWGTIGIFAAYGLMVVLYMLNPSLSESFDSFTGIILGLGLGVMITLIWAVDERVKEARDGSSR